MKRNVLGDDSDDEDHVTPVKQTNTQKKVKKFVIPTFESVSSPQNEQQMEELQEEELPPSEAEDPAEATEKPSNVSKSVHTSLFEDKPSIGLAMMLKMGFKVGDSLGKESQKPEQTPISVQPKLDKLGIGAKPKKLQLTLSELQSIPKEELHKYVDRIVVEKKKSRLSTTIQSVMKYCFEISGDSNRWYEHHDLEEVNELWRPYALNLLSKDAVSSKRILVHSVPKEARPVTANVKHISDVLSDDEKLALLLQYLRDVHRYCFFCGTEFADKNDMQTHCPGIFEEDHVAQVKT